MLVAVAAIAASIAAPAAGAADRYPGGGGQFSGSAEGWQVAEASCNVPVLCSASGGYDGSDGSPGGSLAAETNIGLNLVSQFQSTVTLQSPDFEVETSGAATMRVERRFVPGSLIDLGPELHYTAQLLDRISGKRSTSVSETVADASGWSGEDGSVTVQAGHTYAIVLTARISSTLAGTGLLSGATTARFDNVAITVFGDGGSGRGNGGGADHAVSAERLAALAPATITGPAQLRGNRLYVKARCPGNLGRPCRLAVRGLLKKHRPATTQRRVKVASGKSKRLVLRVRPRAKGPVAGRKRLLFKIRLRAGGAQATTLKRLRLIRR